ncbi:MAG: FG-GAP-like repeat-containing protein [Acidobacteriota bacterium]
MFTLRRSLALCLLALASADPSALRAGGSNLAVVSTSPSAATLGADVLDAIAVTFDRPVDPASLVTRRSFWAFGRWSGTVSGSFVLSNGDRTVSLVPDRSLSAGERVMVILSHDLEGADGTALRDAGYSFQFWTSARPASLTFEEVDRWSTRTTPGETSRAYGGIGSDLDGDGYPDIAIVNEDTEDLRVFMNQADGTGTFGSMLTPTSALGTQASPSEPSDFDRDGEVDIAVANPQDSTVSILLGQGDGSFGSQQLLPVAATPRGIAVLDADGDGDVDIAVASTGASALTLFVNDGSGAFAPSAGGTFGTGTAGEWALAAVDLDEDGLLDLVDGGRNDERLHVHLGNGDGTFSAAGSQDAGGRVWMLATGDVNGDGHEDVAGVNSNDNNGAILLGNGAGALAAPTTYATDPFPLAVDLGDLDGDGDLDWMTSSFSGDWFLFTNDGTGTFTFDQEFLAPRAASCSLLLDVDRDGDLDLALVDELEDEVIVLVQGAVLFADGFEGGDTGAWSASVPE